MEVNRKGARGIGTVLNMVHRGVWVRSYGQRFTLTLWPAIRSPIQIFVGLFQWFA